MVNGARYYIREYKLPLVLNEMLHVLKSPKTQKNSQYELIDHFTFLIWTLQLQKNHIMTLTYGASFNPRMLYNTMLETGFSPLIV